MRRGPARLGRAERAAGEAGVTLILIAMIMLAILTMVGIVLDLGQLRLDRRDDQRNADMAALSAGYYMAGKGSGSSAVANPMEACKAALGSAKSNVVGFPSGATFSPSCSAFPANATDCESYPELHGGAAMPVTTLTTDDGTAPAIVMTLSYPVPASAITDARLAGGSGLLDGEDPCARMMVSFSSTRPTHFARIVGVTSQTIEARAVVKSNLDSTAKNVAALLLLERSNCAVLDTGGQGKVIVQSPSNLNPGRVQIDSEGKGTCTTNENSSGYVIYAANTGNSRIEVLPTADGKPGIIGLYSLTPGVNGRGGANFTSATATNGLSVNPVASGVSSRDPVDDKYNPSTRAAITSLHARASSAVRSAAPSGATVVNGASCANAGSIATSAVAYVDCPNFSAGDSTSFPNATYVYFTGNVTVANNKSLAFPVAERIYVRGCRLDDGTSTNCGNNPLNGYAMSVDGTLLVNTSTYAACPVLTPAAPPSTVTLTHRTTELATVGGPVVFSAGSRVAMCQTFVYVGRSTSTYQIQTRTTGLPNCTEALPCPADGTGSGNTLTPWVDEGYLNMPAGGGSGNAIFWTSPNRTGGAPTADNPYDDMALWCESSRPSFLKGTGTSRVAGVFFLPNSYITLLGQGDSNQPLNAQFIARGLSISGQGVVVLRPNPDDAVSSAAPGGYSLIR